MRWYSFTGTCSSNRWARSANGRGRRGRQGKEGACRHGRRRAAACLRTLGSRSAAPVLAAQLGREPDGEVKAAIDAVGTDAGKEIIISRIQLAETGPRYCHFPREYDEEWFAQLTAEEVREVKKNGFTQRIWHKTRPRNEALDIRVYSLACYEILNPSMRKIREQVEAAGAKARPGDFILDPHKTMPAGSPSPAPPQAPVPVVPPVRRPFVRPSGNWMGGGGKRW